MQAHFSLGTFYFIHFRESGVQDLLLFPWIRKEGQVEKDVNEVAIYSLLGNEKGAKGKVIVRGDVYYMWLIG